MPLIVQNATGTVEDANAYVTVDELIAYFNDRGFAADDFDTEEIEYSITNATDYIDYTFEYRSAKENTDQSTEFPRVQFGLPNDVKKACFEYARISLEGVSLSPVFTYDDNGQEIKSTSVGVGPLKETIVYQDEGGKDSVKQHPKADKYLRKYLIRAVNSSTNSLVRA